MSDPDRSLEALRDEHALLCERYALSLEQIGDDGGVEQFDTHQVAFGTHIMLGHKITTVGVGLTNTSVPLHHALGEVTLDPVQQQRMAILFCSARIVTEVYDSQTARYGLRGSGVKLPSGETTSPLLTIRDSDTSVLRRRGSLLHGWMARLLEQVVGDPYYSGY